MLLSVHAHAATYWVSKSGSDSNGCNASTTPLTTTAKLTILDALTDCLRAGDTVRVRAGTYNESFVWPTAAVGSSWSSPAILEENPGESVLWTVPSGSRRIFDMGGNHGNQYVIVRGFTMDGSNGANQLVSLAYTQASVPRSEKLLQLSGFHILIENNELRYTSYGAIEVSLVSGATDQDITIRNNYIHHHCVVLNCNMIYIKAPGIIFEQNTVEDVAGSVGYWNQDSPTSVNNGIIRNNVFRRTGMFWATQGENGNHPSGGTRWCQSCLQQGGGGVFISSGSGTQAYGNEFYDNAGGINASYGGDNCKIFNNTVYGNRTTPAVAGFDNTQTGGITVLNVGGGSTGCEVYNNIVYTPGVTNPAPMILTDTATFSNNMCSSGSAAGIGCTTDNPGFISAAGGNLQLEATSNAIDAGLDLTSVCPSCATDRLGTARGAGSWDLGAYEFEGGATPDPDTLAAHWTFNAGTGTTAVDSSGNGFTLTALGNATWTTGIIGLFATILDGNGDFWQGVGASLLRPTNTFGIAAWWRGTTAKAHEIFSMGDSYGMEISQRWAARLLPLQWHRFPRSDVDRRQCLGWC